MVILYGILSFDAGSQAVNCTFPPKEALRWLTAASNPIKYSTKFKSEVVFGAVHMSPVAGIQRSVKSFWQVKKIKYFTTKNLF